MFHRELYKKNRGKKNAEEKKNADKKKCRGKKKKCRPKINQTEKKKSKKSTQFPSFCCECLRHQKEKTSFFIMLNLKRLFFVHDQKQILHQEKKNWLKTSRTSPDNSNITHTCNKQTQPQNGAAKILYILYKKYIRFIFGCSFSKDAAVPLGPKLIRIFLAKNF